MSVLIYAYRKQDIIRRKADLTIRLMSITEKLYDLHSYSTSIADGSVSLNDLMKCPPSMFNRMTMYMMYSDAAAQAGAQEKFALMSQTPGAMPQFQTQQQASQYQQLMFKSLYDGEREKFKKQEEQVLNEQDKKIEQEKAKIDQQLKLLDGELASIKEVEAEAAKNAAPKYVA